MAAAGWEEVFLREGRALRPTSKGGRKIAIIGEMFYTWRCMRVILLLPATFSKTGRIGFLPCGWPTWSTIVGWLCVWTFVVMLVYSIGLREINKAQVRAHALQEYSTLITLLLLCLFELYLPYPVFASMPAFGTFTASWERMEALYETLTGVPLTLGIHPVVYAVIVTQLFGLYLVPLLYDHIGLSIWMLPPVIHAVFCMFTLVQVWASGYMAVGVLCYRIKKRMASDCERLGAGGVRAHHLLWLHVVELLQLYHACWSKVQLPFIFCLFLVITVYFFNFVYAVITILQNLNKCVDVSCASLQANIFVLRHVVANITMYGTGSVALLLLCLSAHVAVESILSVRKILLRLPVKGRSQAFRYELANFMEDVRSRDPSVSLSGFILINRPRAVTIAVTAVTYIVVLSQFTLLD